jgi:short-subunit dehydrogenase
MPDLAGKVALVTGASSGIGAAMARQLAAWKCDLVVTARRQDRLEALCGELGALGVSARAVREDLADPGGPARLHAAVRALGPIDILVNNAGFGAYQSFADTPWPRHVELLQLNVLSLVELCHRFLPDLLARPGRAHVLNVASIAAFVSVPYFASYGGSKAYVLGFSESLAAELAASNVRVTCLCPGGTWTEFSEVSGQTLGRAARAGMMSAERCAVIGLRGMLRGRRVVVPGGSNKATHVLSRLMPRRLMGAAGARILGKPATAALPRPEPQDP